MTSLPILPFPEGLQSAIESAPVQQFKGTLLELDTQKSLKRKIKQILTSRGMYSQEYKHSWKTFFSRLPCGDDTDRPDEHLNVLASLVREYGRDVHGHPDFKPVPADLDDYGMIDAVQYAGGPIEHAPFMNFRRSIADGEKGCVRKRRQKSGDFSGSSSDDDRTEKPVIKNENRRMNKQSKKEVPLVDDLPNDVQASKIISRRKRVLLQPSKDEHADVLPVVNKKPRVESLDGTSPFREGSSVKLEYYKGIHLMNMKSILEKMFGESSCGRVRVSLSLGVNDYSLKQSVFRDMCEALLRCSNEADFVELLKLEGENPIKFMFFYAGRDNLSECIIGDGFCSLRNAIALALGYVPELRYS